MKDRHEEIRAIRGERGCGFQEAQRVWTRNNLTAKISAAETVDDLRSVLFRMLHDIYPRG